MIAVLVVGYFLIHRSSTPSSIQPAGVQVVQYRNDQYGFTFDLPESWVGYKIIESTEKDDYIDNQSQVSNYKISIRHPLWTTKVPRQDIPIMIFTISQWNDVKAGKLIVSAAPFPPSELGRNAK